MPWQKIQGERVKRKFEVLAVYNLWHKNYFGRGYSDSVEECHEWIKENKYYRVETSEGAWHNAIMTTYTITEIVETRTIVEKEKVDFGV